MLNESMLTIDIFCTTLISCKLHKACLRQIFQFFDAATSSLWC